MSKTLEETKYTATPKIPKDQQQIYDWGNKAGRDSMKEEILEKMPKRKSEQKKRKDQDEWINIPRIQRAVGFNSCLKQVEDIIKGI